MLWYNRESYEYYVNQKYGDYSYVKALITKTELNLISEYTISSNEKGFHILSNNCTEYAVLTWNMISSNSQIALSEVKLAGVYTPQYLCDYIDTKLGGSKSADVFLKRNYGYYNTTFINYSF